MSSQLGFSFFLLISECRVRNRRAMSGLHRTSSALPKNGLPPQELLDDLCRSVSLFLSLFLILIRCYLAPGRMLENSENLVFQKIRPNFFQRGGRVVDSSGLICYFFIRSLISPLNGAFFFFFNQRMVVRCMLFCCDLCSRFYFTMEV